MSVARAVVESQRKYAQEIETGGHRLRADEPTSAGGDNSGPAPYGLLLSALGACTSATLRMYAERKGWELGTIHVALEHEPVKDGRDRIARRIRLSAPLSDEQKRRLGEIAAKTPVTRTLQAGADIATTIE